MIRFKIKIDDKDLFKKIKKQSVHLEVGIWGDKYENGETVATIAARNEFGNPPKQPPRPFFRNAISRNKRKWREFVQDRLVIDLDAKKTLGFLGEIISDDIRDSIWGFTTPPNAPATIRKKGFNKPLIETGKMVSNVRMKVK